VAGTSYGTAPPTENTLRRQDPDTNRPRVSLPKTPVTNITTTLPTEHLIPTLDYEGTVNWSMFSCIGQDTNDFDAANNSTFQVIGLTEDIIVVTETKEIPIMLQLLNIDLNSLPHADTELHRQQIMLKRLCQEFNTAQVLRDGIMLTSKVVPCALVHDHYT
jgi:hypothetical protein